MIRTSLTTKEENMDIPKSYAKHFLMAGMLGSLASAPMFKPNRNKTMANAWSGQEIKQRRKNRLRNKIARRSRRVSCTRHLQVAYICLTRTPLPTPVVGGDNGLNQIRRREWRHLILKKYLLPEQRLVRVQCAAKRQPVFNKRKDGMVKLPSDIMRELKKELSEWEKEPVFHAKCE